MAKVNFKEISISENLINYATRESVVISNLKNSITEGKGSTAGIIGEIVSLKQLNCNKTNLVNTYDFDIKDNDGITWDVKTKRRTVEPKGNYYASVANYNTTQKCDRYIFVSIKYDKVLDIPTNAYIMGWIEHDKFYKEAFFAKKGEYDPSSPPSYKFHFTADCWNLEYKKLNQF